ncbi:putative transposase-like protein [Trichonephila clavipes]|nr:putative transposase-like protein [Trichonephila clavipes]
MADWRRVVHEVILDYVEENSQQIGGKDGIVEIDESKFGKRIYNRGHLVEGQWVFGGVERGTGKMFLVAVHNRTKETLMGLIQEWIKPGTTIYSDCWKSCATLGQAMLPSSTSILTPTIFPGVVSEMTTEATLRISLTVQTQIVAPTTPTRFGYNSPSIIEFALTRNIHWPSQVESIAELISDHNPLIIYFDTNTRFAFPKRNATTDWEAFRELPSPAHYTFHPITARMGKTSTHKLPTSPTRS